MQPLHWSLNDFSLMLACNLVSVGRATGWAKLPCAAGGSWLWSSWKKTNTRANTATARPTARDHTPTTSKVSAPQTPHRGFLPTVWLDSRPETFQRPKTFWRKHQLVWSWRMKFCCNAPISLPLLCSLYGLFLRCLEENQDYKRLINRRSEWCCRGRWCCDHRLFA